MVLRFVSMFLLLFSLSYGKITSGYSDYMYRAYSIGGDSKSSEAIIKKSDAIYTVKVFSKKHINKNNSSLAGDFTVLILHVDNSTKQIKLSADYKNSDVVLRVFDNSSLVYETDPVFLDDNYINVAIELP